MNNKIVYCLFFLSIMIYLKPMKQKSLKKNAVLNLIKTFMSLIFPLITFPYVSRILSPDGIGRINFVNNILSYFTMLALMGITTYGAREVATRRENQTELNKFFTEITIINIFSTLISFTIFLILVFTIPRFKVEQNLLLMGSISIFFTTFGIGWFFSGIEEYEYITIRTILFQIISILLLFLFVKTKNDLTRYFLIGILSSTGSNILNLFYSRKFVHLSFKQKLEIKKHLKPIIALFGIILITSVYNVLDTTMLGFLSTDEEIGYYTAATKINRIVLMVVSSISAVIFPRLSLYASKNQNDEFLTLTKKCFSIITGISLPCIFGLNILAEPITLRFCGNDFISCIPLMKLMNPIIMIVGLSNFIGAQVFIPLNKEKLTIISVSMGATINFILNFILIPKYQSFGAGIATLTAESTVFIFEFILSRKYVKFTIFNKEIIGYIINTLIMSIIVYFSNLYLPENNFSFIISIILGMISYYIGLILLKNEFIVIINKYLLCKITGKTNE